MTTKKRARLNCPLCKESDLKVVRKGVRGDAEKEVYGCTECDIHFLEPPNCDLRDYYRDEYRKNHSSAIGEDLGPKERFDLMRPLMQMRESVFRENIPPGSKVLEVGCSSGFFLDTIRGDYSCYGAEWNPDDAAYVRDELGLPCEEGNLDEIYPGQTFTVIAAYHVLEHVADPMEWIRVAKSRLIGGGWLCLEVPNIDNALLSIYNAPGFSDFYYRKPHLTYFNMPSLAKALGLNGFEARVALHEPYSITNHINWILNGSPQADAQTAQLSLAPVPLDHPAAGVMNRWFTRIDREYKVLLDTMKATSSLMAVGRKREI